MQALSDRSLSSTRKIARGRLRRIGPVRTCCFCIHPRPATRSEFLSSIAIAVSTAATATAATVSTTATAAVATTATTASRTGGPLAGFIDS